MNRTLTFSRCVDLSTCTRSAFYGQVAFEDSSSEADFAILIVGAMPGFYRVSPNKQQRRCNGCAVHSILTCVSSAFVVSSVLQLSQAQSASRIPKPCDRLRKIRAHARPDRATKRILLRGVARDDDHRLSPCMISDVGLRRPVVEGAGPQRPAGPVGADDDARGRSLRADEREFAWRGSIRKETFACA